MVEASKFWFERTCSGSDCRDLIHPWTAKCSDANFSMLLSCVKGAYKFYAMVYLVSNIFWFITKKRSRDHIGHVLKKG